MRITRKKLIAPKVEYEVEEETGVGWCAGIAYPVFMLRQRCFKLANARQAAKERKAERPRFTVRVVKRTPTIVAEY